MILLILSISLYGETPTEITTESILIVKDICHQCGEYLDTPKCCDSENREWDDDSGFFKGSPGDIEFQKELLNNTHEGETEEEPEEIKESEEETSEPPESKVKKKKKYQKPDSTTGATSHKKWK